MSKGLEAVAEKLSRGNFSRISRESGHTSQHVSRVLRGLKDCSFAAAWAIADASGVTLDELRLHIEHERDLSARRKKAKATAKAAKKKAGSKKKAAK